MVRIARLSLPLEATPPTSDEKHVLVDERDPLPEPLGALIPRLPRRPTLLNRPLPPTRLLTLLRPFLKRVPLFRVTPRPLTLLKTTCDVPPILDTTAITNPGRLCSAPT